MVLLARACLLLFTLSLVSSAAIITLTFEGLKDLELVGNFYNGGTGGNGSGPGTNYGITFNADSLAVVDSNAGGTGDIGGEPSPDTVLFFRNGSAAIMNVSAGFDTGFSFFYSAINQSGSIQVWDGLDGTGNVLAILALPLTQRNGAPDPNGAFSPFVPVGVSFSGTAKSVSFAGVQDQIGFDNITFGTATPAEEIPEPSAYVLAASGMALAFLLRHKK